MISERGLVEVERDHEASRIVQLFLGIRSAVDEGLPSREGRGDESCPVVVPVVEG